MYRIKELTTCIRRLKLYIDIHTNKFEQDYKSKIRESRKNVHSQHCTFTSMEHRNFVQNLFLSLKLITNKIKFNKY
jgi:hypothetical protein